MRKKTNDRIVNDVRNFERIASKQVAGFVFYFAGSLILIALTIYLGNEGAGVLDENGILSRRLISIIDYIPAFSVCRKILSWKLSAKMEVALQYQYVYAVSAFSGGLAGILLLAASRYYIYLQYLDAVRDVCMRKKGYDWSRSIRFWLGATMFVVVVAYVLFAPSVTGNYCIQYGLSDQGINGQIKLAVLNFCVFCFISSIIAGTIISILFQIVYCRGRSVVIPDGICSRLRA